MKTRDRHTLSARMCERVITGQRDGLDELWYVPSELEVDVQGKAGNYPLWDWSGMMHQVLELEGTWGTMRLLRGKALVR
jgi:hypothetical protein